MLSSEWLHRCGARVYLFDWFECIRAGYAAAPQGLAHQPPLHHFLRHSCYFSDSKSSKKSPKRQKVDSGTADPAMAHCAQCVRRAVSDDWHRPKLSWAVPAPCGDRVIPEWPQFVGNFDSAALLSSGSWQPFLQTAMENASDECSTLEIGAAVCWLSLGAGLSIPSPVCF
jgi:hypothetical protein